MARTQAGATLTEVHRQGQTRLRAQALQAFVTLWPLWRGDEASFQRLLEASLPLVTVFHGMSSSLASGYFEAFRAAEGIKGNAAPQLGTLPAREEILGTLHLTGRDMTAKAIAGGHSPQAAMQQALVRTSGTVTRFVQQGARDTLVRSSAADSQAQGWARVTSGNPCPFCAMIASRGPVFSEDAAAFEAHDHCGCMAEPYYSGSEWPGRGKEFRDLFNQAQREAREAGELERGTSNDALNAFRRLL